MPYSILVVEDEPNIIDSLSFLMRREGHDVRVAQDGDAALKAVAAARPDLVILDVMLPERDGFEVCRLIRANDQWQGIKIILLTAKGRDSDREKGMAVGANDYITKPFSTREIVARVRELLEGT